MKLLFLSKRQPQQRDLVERPYGRFFHLPTELAQRGHTVHVALLGHRRTRVATLERSGVTWHASDVLSQGPAACWRELKRATHALRPDWIIGCSDLYYGILATRLAKVIGARAAIDAYDNFESYLPLATPLHWLWHRALARADLVTAAGPQLAALLQRHHGKAVHVLPMAADPQFAPADRSGSRQRLGLPAEAILIGHCGSFTTTRGSRVLLDAFARVRSQRPGARLVLTGRYPSGLDRCDGVIGLGMVADERMPSVLASLDVACVLLADTAFGRYSYPAKLYEAMACGVPLVASATEPARWILGNAAAHLARVGDARALADQIASLIATPAISYASPAGWAQIAQQMEVLLAG